MNRNIFKCKKVAIYSCKICHSDFCPVNLASAELMFVFCRVDVWSCLCFLLNCGDCILSTRKAHVNLYKTCPDACGSVDHFYDSCLT